VPPALVAVLRELAEREGVDTATICIAFVLAHPGRPVALIGSINPDRIGEANRALDVQLDRADVYRIIEASMGESLP
jgi:predicted oxidoreductase